VNEELVQIEKSLNGKDFLSDAHSSNPKASKDFNQTFKNISDEKWYKLSNGEAAEFTRDNAKTIVVYDQKGNWKFTLTSYAETKLPVDVRKILAQQYFGYTITLAEEIKVEESLIYLIHLENEKVWKIVRVCDSAIDELESYEK
jgi:hypothetical protein